jgi:predicted RNase H-like nuclease (RuvC/YqgF family)
MNPVHDALRIADRARNQTVDLQVQMQRMSRAFEESRLRLMTRIESTNYVLQQRTEELANQKTQVKRLNQKLEEAKDREGRLKSELGRLKGDIYTLVADLDHRERLEKDLQGQLQRLKEQKEAIFQELNELTSFLLIGRARELRSLEREFRWRDLKKVSAKISLVGGSAFAGALVGSFVAGPFGAVVGVFTGLMLPSIEQDEEEIDPESIELRNRYRQLREFSGA